MKLIEKLFVFVLLIIVACTGDDIVSTFDKRVFPTQNYLEFRWTHPTTGTTAVDYEVESQGYGLPAGPADCIVWLDDDYGYGRVVIPAGAFTVRIRVSGVDSAGVQGPWSLWSNWRIDPYERVERRNEPSTAPD